MTCTIIHCCYIKMPYVFTAYVFTAILKYVFYLLKFKILDTVTSIFDRMKIVQRSYEEEGEFIFKQNINSADQSTTKPLCTAFSTSLL